MTAVDDPIVWIHDAQRGRWLYFTRPAEVVRASCAAQAEACLRRVEACVAAGKAAAGFVSYEAGAGLDAAIRVKEGGGLPPVWFGIYDAWEARELPEAANDAAAMDWRPSITRADYRAAIERIKRYILEGETYQINYTFRLRAELGCEPFDLFLQMAAAQQGGYGAYIQTAEHAICCASPELFFEVDGRTVRSQPMKGTAPRGPTFAEDEAQAAALANGEKTQAENVMIVDMVRNDLHRVCDAGSVRVERLFEAQRYPTLWQLTSTVAGETDAGLTELFKALFPAASITGAPKIRTCELITETEDSPRGIYTGSIGFALPGPERRAQFNVAIRTVLADRARGTAEYGTGGAILWDSAEAAEYEECFTKARVLTHRRPEFELLETLLWEPTAGYFLLERHLRRLTESAVYFGYAVDLERVRRELWREAERFEAYPQRVRLLAGADGACRVEHRRQGAVTPPRVCLAKSPVHSGDVFLYHKTTHRRVYEEKLAERPGYDDVLLWNERGELTETCIANVVVERGGERLTPPVRCGLLAGTYRDELLERGEIREAVIRVEELRVCKAIRFINSVRGRYEAHPDMTLG